MANLKSRSSESSSPWSIGIYAGSGPFQLFPAPGVNNPVLTAADVTDISAAFVADPFMIKVGKTWHMFFEVMNEKTENGEIGLATSLNGLDWNYQRIVLKEPFHLSYPYVFAWRGAYYMIPETLTANFIQIYKAKKFPTEWSLHAKLVAGAHSDPSIVYFTNQWWLFACSTPYEHDTLRLYFSRRLRGPCGSLLVLRPTNMTLCGYTFLAGCVALGGNIQPAQSSKGIDASPGRQDGS
jgi:hypothetical protein